MLTALALLAIGLSALSSAIPVAATAVSEGASLSTATFLAAARLEEVRAVAWSAAPPEAARIMDESIRLANCASVGTSPVLKYVLRVSRFWEVMNYTVV